MKWLADLLRGGQDELGWDDLVRRSVLATAKLARYAERGRKAFPPSVTVRIEVGEGSVDVVRGFVGRPDFDVAVGAALANECDCPTSDLPVREYAVSAAPSTRVTATEGAPMAWQVAIEGGDAGGRVVVLPRGAVEVRFGRGRWHGADLTLPNDVIVCERTEYISRRAGRLVASGPGLEVESLDQGDTLFVRRADGAAVRPARTAKGRVVARDGDVVELTDGNDRAVRLVLRRVSLEERASAGPDA